ncbi:hypothetical protein [uncultured Nostoc sp.]|uniref:hypothetical protein n=1 Tax=uncultured Nostoc sp. TaxID=340711 RepID=UPI0035CB502A
MLIVNSESLNGNLEVRSLFLTNNRGAEKIENEQSDRTVGILQAIAFLTNRRGHRGRRGRSHCGDLAIAFLNEPQRK